VRVEKGADIGEYKEKVFFSGHCSVQVQIKISYHISRYHRVVLTKILPGLVPCHKYSHTVFPHLVFEEVLSYRPKFACVCRKCYMPG
jgi:hypothetical protein